MPVTSKGTIERATRTSIRHKKRQDKRHDNTGPYAAPPAFADM